METVLRLKHIDIDPLVRLLNKYQLTLEIVTEGDIPGSYWGEDEAGLIGHKLLAKPDTPIHSILHEGCHFICMDTTRREKLDTDAAGDFEEENGVCFLQILLADDIPEMGRQRMMLDMDHWGYTFRLGTAQNWFEQDAEDTQEWLLQHDLVKDNQSNLVPSYQLRL